MYKCEECRRTFEAPETFYEKHGLDCPPYEKICLCPFCGSSEFDDYIPLPTSIEKETVFEFVVEAITKINYYLYSKEDNNVENLEIAVSKLINLIQEMLDDTSEIDYLLLNATSELEKNKILDLIIKQLEE